MTNATSKLAIINNKEMIHMQGHVSYLAFIHLKSLRLFFLLHFKTDRDLVEDNVKCL